MSMDENSGAGNESRTRDLNLGKVALYQLSYSRVFDLYQIKQEQKYKPVFLFLQTAKTRISATAKTAIIT